MSLKKSKKRIPPPEKEQERNVRSIVFRMVALILSIIIPVNVITLVLVSVILQDNYQALDTSRQNSLEMSFDDFTKEIKKINRLLLYYSFSDEDFKTLGFGATKMDSLELSNRVISAKKTLEKIRQHTGYPVLVYAYFPEVNHFITNGNLGINRADYIDTIHELAEEVQTFRDSKWRVSEIKDIPFLFGCSRWHGTVYGMAINLDWIVSRLHLIRSADSLAFFTNREETLVTSQGRADLQNGSASEKMPVHSAKYDIYRTGDARYDLRLVYAVPRTDLFSSLSSVMRFLAILAFAVTVASVPLLLLVMRKLVLHPLNRLNAAMDEIENGDLDYRVEEKANTKEFLRLEQHLNQTMDEVNQLKIENYEERIEKQEIRMTYLTQQIQPHFILNAMNILYSYEPEQYALSQKMILCISKYFRYIVNARAMFVSLKQEMSHVSNYFEIQKARYPELFFYSVRYEEGLAGALIPPLLIQNFAENCIKYSLKVGTEVQITVEAERFIHEDGTPLMRISLKDTGEGISEEVLAEIDEFKKTGKQQPHLGVGIQNSIERLKYLYPEKHSSISFSNNPRGSGAHIEIILPIHDHERPEKFPAFV